MSTINERSFNHYISKILKQVHPDKHITKAAKDTVDGAIRLLATKLASTAHRVAISAGVCTISAREVQTSVRLLLVDQLNKQAVSEGTKAVTKFTNFPSEGVTTPTRREVRAGLQFSVSLVEKYLRQTGLKVGATASVYLASVLEYIAAEILELSGSQTHNDRRTNMTRRHIVLAIQQDGELETLFRTNGITILGGGIVPHLESELSKKKPKKKLKSREGPQPHRWRPGTVAKREVKKIQKSDKMLLQKAPFAREVRDIAAKFGGDLRFTQKALTVLQEYIESDMVSFFKACQKFAIHAKRETVNCSDLDLYFTLNNLVVVADDWAKQRIKKKGKPWGFTNPGIQRLARRGGVIRIAGDVYEHAKAYIDMTLAHHLENIVNFTVHNRGKTVSVKSVLNGLAVSGVHLAVTYSKIKRKKIAEN